MWGPVSVPSQFLTDQLFVHTGAPALFSGNPYGERAVLLQHPGLAGLLAFLPSPENQTKLPQIFDQLNGEILAQMLAEPFSMERYMGYLEGLRMVRRQAFQMYIEGLKQGCAVVNLPSFLKGYAGRVVEGMAAGRPVISWEVPSDRKPEHCLPGIPKYCFIGMMNIRPESGASDPALCMTRHSRSPWCRERVESLSVFTRRKLVWGKF